MRFNEAYLQTVLSPAPASRIAELFKRRNEAIRRDAGAEPEQPKQTLTPLQVEATLTRVGGQILTASIEENERELMTVVGQTDVHTAWWKRLKVVNENRDVLAGLGKQSAHWGAIVARIETIVTLSITEREDARNRFFEEVTPIILRPKSRMSEVYALTQKYGDKHTFEALMWRLLVDAPDFHELEKPFFERFNPQVTAGLNAFLDQAPIPRASYCPIPKAQPVELPWRHIAASVVLVVATAALLIWT
jgi:hypothetical protein